MRIGVSTLALYPANLEDVLSYLEDLKVEYCEIINEYPYHDLERNIIDSYKLKINIHAPLSDINLASSNYAIRKSSISQIKKSIETASLMDSEIVVVHPGTISVMAAKFKDKVSKDCISSLRECSKYADEHSIDMCVENMPHIDGFLCQDINHLKDVVEDIDSFITMDVGHAHTNQYTVKEMLKLERIRHIHLSDNDGSYDSHNAVGSDNIDFKSLIKQLNKLNYKGNLTIEVKNREEVLKSLEYLKKIL
ncbi:MAG: sugar phosphate isomerase/epimerase [Methanobacteriaceae archaeon]|nr:sugar phosphate isomerase/epimerase [Methanobacteriaceae archaeon]